MRARRRALPRAGARVAGVVPQIERFKRNGEPGLCPARSEATRRVKPIQYEVRCLFGREAASSNA